MKGYIQVYTGNGKGKTTAALGLALRALGAGFRVYIAQFVKGRPCHEFSALAVFGEKIRIRQFGRGRFVRGKPKPADIAAAREGLAETAQALASGNFDLVILDEANVAVDIGLFAAADLLRPIETRPAHVEVVITGRGAPAELIAAADLVTEMRAIKHYYNRHVGARPGIEY